MKRSTSKTSNLDSIANIGNLSNDFLDSLDKKTDIDIKKPKISYFYVSDKSNYQGKTICEEIKVKIKGFCSCNNEPSHVIIKQYHPLPKCLDCSIQTMIESAQLEIFINKSDIIFDILSKLYELNTDGLIPQILTDNKVKEYITVANLWKNITTDTLYTDKIQKIDLYNFIRKKLNLSDDVSITMKTKIIGMSSKALLY